MLPLFQRLANARALLALLVLYILFPAWILPMAEAQLKAYSGEFGPLDLLFSYTPAEAFERIAALGEEGRLFYRNLELTADIVYPIAYTLFFGALLVAVLRRASPTNPRVQGLALSAFVTFCLDMAENVGIVTMLTQFPTQSATIAMITSLLTSLKWVSFGVMMLTLVGGLVMWGVRRFSAPAKPGMA